MTPAEFIADLYEIKDKLIQPITMGARRQEYIEPNITYAVIQTLIATLSDKYDVDGKDVSDVFHKKEYKKEQQRISVDRRDEFYEPPRI